MDRVITKTKRSVKTGKTHTVTKITERQGGNNIRIFTVKFSNPPFERHLQISWALETVATNVVMSDFHLGLEEIDHVYTFVDNNEGTVRVRTKEA